MKKIILTGVINASLFTTTAFAETGTFLKDCKDNHTEVISREMKMDSATNSNASTSAYVSNTKASAKGFEALWEDSTVVSESELAASENSLSNDEEDFHYNLKLVVTSVTPYSSGAVGYDAETKEQKETGLDALYDNTDKAQVKICSESNYNAAKLVQNINSSWFVVSVEKYKKLDASGSEELVDAAMASEKTYELTFAIPSSTFKDNSTVKMIKIEDGKTEYVEDTDSNTDTFTISAKGSAGYAFAGEPVESN